MGDKTGTLVRFTIVLGVLVALTSLGFGQPPEVTKKAADPKSLPAGMPVLKLPDGTYLWTAALDGGDQVILPLKEYQKIQEQFDQFKKQLAALKPVAPSRCAIHGRVEKQGEQSVAVITLTYTFRTPAARTSIILGGRKGLPVASSLDGSPHLLLETADDGFVALIEKAGDHSLTLELHTPITARGSSPKAEIGFEIGLPRATITTFLFGSPRADIKLVTLGTRTPDPGSSRPADIRRTVMDVKQLAPHPDRALGLPLGPVDLLELAWEAPPTAAQPADQLRTAGLDVSVVVTEATVETTTRIKLSGPAREWRFVLPPTAEVAIDHAAPDAGPTPEPTLVRPADAARPVWRISFAAGVAPADWVITAFVRQSRGKAGDSKHRGPFSIGPYSVLDVQRQTGTIRVTAGADTRLSFRHGVELRPTPVPGPPEEDVTAAAFRLATGPTGTAPPGQLTPLLTMEASAHAASVIVKPAYKLSFDKANGVWQIQADIRVIPSHTTVDAIPIEVPSEWTGVDAPATVSSDAVALGKPDGFWGKIGAKLNHGGRVPTVLKVPEGKKHAFDLVLTSKVTIPPGATDMAISLLRFPGAEERETSLTVNVPEGLEVRQVEALDGPGDGWTTGAIPQTSNLSPGVRPNHPGSTVTVSRPGGLSRVVLRWALAGPDLSAEITAAATLGDRQLEVVERVRLTAPEGMPNVVRLRSRLDKLAGLREKVVAPAGAQLLKHSANEMLLSFPPEAKEAVLEISYAIPLDRHPPDGAAWSVPVGLLWPTGGRVAATVRFWCNTSMGRALVPPASGWRELPSDPVPERDFLPTLSLFAIGSDIPLVIEAHEVRTPTAIGVWVDRTLIQAWVGADGGTRYSARFLVRRWRGPTLDIRLPGGTSDPSPEVYRDGSRVKDASAADGPDRTVRVPLDLWAGKPVVVELRYLLPPRLDDDFHPPSIANAAFAGPVRWQISVPPGSVPVLTAGASPEFRWRWQAGSFGPGPARTARELEVWFKAGDDPTDDEVAEASPGETITARQFTPDSVSLLRVSRTGLVILCSVVIFLLVMALSTLRAAVIGPAIAGLSIAGGGAAYAFPYITVLVLGAGQPGLLAAGAVLLSLAAVRSYYRRRITHLPGFTRSPVDPSAAAPPPASARSRPSGVGSAHLAPGG